jgi:Xaa-Pro aminopeptidase
MVKERAKSLVTGLWGVRVEDTVVVGKEGSRVPASIPCQLEK